MNDKYIEVGVKVNATAIKDVINEITAGVQNSSQFSRSIRDSIAKPLSEIEQKFSKLEGNLNDLQAQLNRTTDSKAFASIAKQMETVEKSMAALREQTDALQQAYTALATGSTGINKGQLRAFNNEVANVKQSVEGLLKTYGRMSELFAITANGTIGDGVTTQLKASAKQISAAIKEIEDAINERDVKNLADIFDMISEKFGEEEFDAKFINDKGLENIEAFVAHLKEVYSEFQKLEKEGKGDIKGASFLRNRIKDLQSAMDSTTDTSKKDKFAQQIEYYKNQLSQLEVLELKYVTEFQSFYKILTQSFRDTDTGKLLDSANKNPNFLKLVNIDFADKQSLREIENQLNTASQGIVERVVEKRVELEKELEHLNSRTDTTVSADTALVSFKDGSIKIPVSLGSTAEDLAAAAGTMIDKANEQLSKRTIKIHLTPDIASQSVSEFAKQSADILQQSYNSADTSLVKEGHAASKILKEDAKTLGDVFNATTFSDLLDALSNIKAALEGIKVQNISGVADAFTSMSFSAPEVSSSFKEISQWIEKLDFTKIAEAVNGLKALVDVVKETDTRVSNVEQKNQWNQITAVWDKLSPKTGETTKAGDEKRKLIENTELRKKYLAILIQEMAVYEKMGGLKSFQDLEQIKASQIKSYTTKLKDFKADQANQPNIFDELGKEVATLTEQFTPLQQALQQASGALTNMQGQVAQIDLNKANNDLLNVTNTLGDLHNKFTAIITDLGNLSKKSGKIWVGENGKNSFTEGATPPEGRKRTPKTSQQSPANLSIVPVTKGTTSSKEIQEAFKAIGLDISDIGNSFEVAKRLAEEGANNAKKESSDFKRTANEDLRYYGEVVETASTIIQLIVKRQAEVAKQDRKIKQQSDALERENYKRYGETWSANPHKALPATDAKIQLYTIDRQQALDAIDSLSEQLLELLKILANLGKIGDISALGSQYAALSGFQKHSDDKKMANLIANDLSAMEKTERDYADKNVKIAEKEHQRIIEAEAKTVQKRLELKKSLLNTLDNKEQNLNNLDKSLLNAEGLSQIEAYSQRVTELREKINSIDWKDLNDSDQINQVHKELQILNADIDHFVNRKQQSEPSIFSSINKDVVNNLKNIIARYASFYVVLNKVTTSMRQGYEAVKAYDAALTNVKYTMNLTESQFNNLGKQTIEMARQLDLSVKDAMQITQIYANMQTNPSDILEIGKPTGVLANLAGISTDEAANEIQSVLQQFELGAEKAQHIVDVYDKVSANIQMDYAKGIANIAAGVEAAGSVANDAGLTFEQLAAIIAKTAEKTREEGGAIGQALKTITVRISKASKLSGADEVDNETVSKAAKALHDIGIEVYKSNGEFNELDEILAKLAAKWDSLSDAQQANISYEVAATRQTNKFRAILASFTDSMDLANEATYADGNALENQEKYAQSIQGLLQGISTEAETFWINLLQSDLIKEFLSLVHELLKALNELMEKAPSATATALAAGGLYTASAARHVIGKGAVSAVSTFLGKVGIGTAAQGAGAAAGATGAAAGAGGVAAISGTTVALGALGVAVAAAAAGWTAYKKAEQDAYKNAVSSAKDIQTTADSIYRYKTSITDLRNELDNSSISDDRRHEIQVQLYDIQDKLITQYGDAADGLNLVNGELKDQLDLLNGIVDIDYSKWLGQIQEGFFYSKTNDELGQEALATLTDTSAKDLGQTFGLALSEEMEAGLQQAARNLNLNLQINGSDYGASDVELTANGQTVEQAKNNLDSYITYVSQMMATVDTSTKEGETYYNSLRSFLSQLSSTSNEFATTLENNNPLSEARLKTLLYNSGNLDLYTTLEDRWKDFDNAVKGGTEDQVAIAQQAYDKAYQDWTNFINNTVNGTDYAWLGRNYVASGETVYGHQQRYKHAVTTEGEGYFANKYASQLKAAGYSSADLLRKGVREEDVPVLNKLISLTNGYSLAWEDAVKVLADAGMTADKTEKAITSLGNATKSVTDSVNKVSDIESKIGSMTQLIDGLKDGNLKASDYAAISSTFGGENGLDSAVIEHYISQLIDLKGNAEGTKETLVSLTEDWVSNLKVFDGETEESVKIIGSLLEDMGVSFNGMTFDQRAAISKSISNFDRFSKESVESLNKAQEALHKYAEDYNTITNGNLDYNNRPIVRNPSGEINTTLDQDYTIGEGTALYTVKVATITEDGRILSDNEIQDYVNSLVTDKGEEALLKSDKQNLIIEYKLGDYDEGFFRQLDQNLDSVKQKHAEAQAEIDDFCDTLVAECEQLGLTTEAQKEYYVQKLIDSGAIDVSGDISALAAICNALGIAGKQWANYYKLRAGLEASAGSAAKQEAFADATKTLSSVQLREIFDSPTKTGSTASLVNEAISTAAETTVNGILAEINNTSKQFEKPNYAPPAGGGKGGGGDKGKKEKEDSEQFVDWYERRITVLQKYHELQQKIANNEFKTFEQRRAAIQEQKKYDQQLIEVYKAQSAEYLKAYNAEMTKLVDANNKSEDNLIKDKVGKGYSLSEIKTLIENGGLQRSEFSDTEYKKLEKFIELYDKYLEIVGKTQDAEEEAFEHWKQYYDSRINELNSLLGIENAEESILQSEITLTKALGGAEIAAQYERLIANSKQQEDILQDQADVYRDMLDELEEGTEEYNNTYASLINCANEIMQCKIEQAEWNEAIENIPINRLKQYLGVLENIQKDVENFMAQENAKGITHNAQQYSELMKIATESLEKSLEEQKLLVEKMSKYEFGSEKYEEVNKEIQDIDNNIASILQNMTEWQKAILQLPIDNIAKVNEQLNLTVSACDTLAKEYDQVITAVTDTIDTQIDKLKEDKDALDDLYDDRISSIQKIIDGLEKENEARQKTLDLEQSEYDLEKAYSQKSVGIIKDGTLQYVEDQEAIRAAQQERDNAQYQYRIYELQKQIEDLETERDDLLNSYDDQIEGLEKVSDKWSEITKNIEQAKDALVATNYLGEGWIEKVVSGSDDDIYTVFKEMYENLDATRTDFEKQVESNERISTLMQQYVDAYINGSVTYEQATSGISALAASINEGLGAADNLAAVQQFLGGGEFSSILEGLKNTVQTEANNYDGYFKIVKDNQDAIAKYTQSWEDVQKSVEKQIADLKAAYEEAQRLAAEIHKYASSLYGRDHDDGGGDRTTNVYVIANSQGEYRVDRNGNVVQEFKSYNGNYTLDQLADMGFEVSKKEKYTKYHEGLELGYVNSANQDEKLKMLKSMALSPLKSWEVPAILQEGEVVLSRPQQLNLLKNFDNLKNSLNAVSSNRGINVNLTMSNLTFNEINNGQDFANYISTNLSSAISQNLAR